MTGLFSSDVQILVIGANHRSSSLALRDRLFLSDMEIIAFLDRMKDAGIEQASVVSTCDRVEIHIVDHDLLGARDKIVQLLCERADLRPDQIMSQLYMMQAEDAVRQIFRLAASLDSLMIGEPQIVSQVKDAHRFALEAGSMGGELERIYQGAFGASKKVRTQTRIGEGPVSIASVAVQVAKEIHGDLTRAKGLLIGAGDMGELTSKSLIESGLHDFTCVHSFDARARNIARALNCHAEPFEQRNRLAAEADIIVTSMNKRTRTVSCEMVERALEMRKNKPIFLIDTGIPGDVESDVNEIDGAFLYDIHDLEQVALQGRASREKEAQNASAILEKELSAFLRGRDERAGAGLVNALRSRFEEERKAVLAVHPNDVEKATHLLINRLLHTPSETLRAMAGESQNPGGKKKWTEAEKLIEDLFLKEK